MCAPLAQTRDVGRITAADENFGGLARTSIPVISIGYSHAGETAAPLVHKTEFISFRIFPQLLRPLILLHFADIAMADNKPLVS